MSQDVSVAHRYAHALFLVAQRRGQVAPALEDLKGLSGILEPDSRIGRFLSSPQVLLAHKRRLLAEGLAGRASPPVLHFVDLLLRKKRLGMFGEIVVAYERLVEESQGIRRAEAVSATPLTAAEQKRLLATLTAKLGGTVRLTTRVDPALLGGLYVRVGDRVIDRTVTTLLEAMRRQLCQVGL